MHPNAAFERLLGGATTKISVFVNSDFVLCVKADCAVQHENFLQIGFIPFFGQNPVIWTYHRYAMGGAVMKTGRSAQGDMSGCWANFAHAA
jgi:hypothetical protein